MKKENDVETDTGFKGVCHSGHRVRMRQRYETTRLEGFHTHEVLELVLFDVIPRANTNGMAHAMLEQRNDSLADVLSDPPDVRGIGDKAKAHLRQLDERMEQMLLEAIAGSMDRSQFFTAAIWYLRRYPERVLLMITDAENHLLASTLSAKTEFTAALARHMSALEPGQFCHLAMRSALDIHTDLPAYAQLGMVLVLDDHWQGKWLT